MDPRVRIDESKSKWVPTDPKVDANELGIDELLKEYERNYEAMKTLKKRNDGINDALKRLGSNFIIEVDGEETWRVRQDGGFEPAKFREAHPDKVAQYTKTVMKPVFDLEAFQKAEPALYQMFRAKRLEKVNK